MEPTKKLPKKNAKMTKADLRELVESLETALSQKDAELEAMTKTNEELAHQMEAQEASHAELETQLASIDINEQTIKADPGSKYSFRIDFYESGQANLNGKITLLSTRETKSFNSLNINVIEAFLKNYLPLEEEDNKTVEENVPEIVEEHVRSVSMPASSQHETDEAFRLPQLNVIEAWKRLDDRATHQIHTSEGFRIRLQLEKDSLKALGNIVYHWDCEVFAKNLETGQFASLIKSERKQNGDDLILDLKKHKLSPGSYRLEANMNFYGKNANRIPVSSFKEGGFLRIFG